MSRHKPEHSVNYIALDLKNRIIADYDSTWPVPYDEGAMPVFQLEWNSYQGYYEARVMNDTAPDYVESLNKFLLEYGQNFSKMERFVRMFHGATILETRVTQGGYLVSFDPQKAVEDGWTDTLDTRKRAVEGALTEWSAWVDNEVYWIRHERHVTGRKVFDDGRPDEHFGEWEIVTSIGGYYGHDAVSDEALKDWAKEYTNSQF